MFLLHLRYASDVHQTLAFDSAFLRALHIILLAGQPVTMAIEDAS
jgi:hypothetical protein